MKYMTLLRTFTMAIAMAAMAPTMSSQSFTVHLKDGSVQSYNNRDVEHISFSPDDYDPTGDEKTILLSEPANTYIISKAGNYEFYPVLPSGKEIAGLSKVDWIWAQKLQDTDTEQQLVSDVSLDGDKVKFTASGNTGNVALAGFDDNGTVVWVWLLWMTPTPEEKEFESGSIFLDRLMGATSAEPADGTRTWGAVVYQWGRPVPIFGGFDEEFGDEAVFAEARRWTVMNPQYNMEWKVEKNNVTLEESIAAPTTFFTGNNSNWLVETNMELWGVEKTDYDPSPAGYKIPASAEWGKTIFDHITIFEDQSGAYYTYKDKNTYFPHGNQNRLYNTGENVIGVPGYMSWNSDYFLDDPAGMADNPNCPWSLEELIQMGLVRYSPARIIMFFHDTAFSPSVQSPTSPSFALPIRCVKVQATE